jgi:hypothetical protein
VLGFQLNATDGVPDATPVPESAICIGGALLATVTLPAARPAAVGSKFTDTLTAWPGARVTFGTLFTVKPLPAAETDEMLTVEFPLFDSMTFWVAPTPIVVVAKVIDAGLAESWTDVAPAVALRATVAAEPEAFVTIETAP